MRLGLRVVFFIHLHLDDLKTYLKRGVLNAPFSFTKISEFLLNLHVAGFIDLYYLCRLNFIDYSQM